MKKQELKLLLISYRELTKRLLDEPNTPNYEDWQTYRWLTNTVDDIEQNLITLEDEHAN